MKIYLRKIDKQCIDKQISFTKDILREFFDNKTNQETIVCIGEKSQTKEDVKLLLATDPRFDNNIKKILNAEGNVEINDIMLMRKLPNNYAVELIKPADIQYQTLHNFFPKKDRHILVSMNSQLDNEFHKETFQVFGVHMKKKNSAFSETSPHICIGWSSLGDLSSIKDEEEIQKLYQKTFPQAKTRTISQSSAIIFRFIKKMQKGDIVVNRVNNIVHIGKVASDYYYKTDFDNQHAEYVNNRDVIWIKKIESTKLPKEFIDSLGAAMSVFSLDKYKELIVELLNENITKDIVDIGDNRLFYGVPGCGKSYYVEKELCKGLDDNYIERVTFHPDYTYGDFIGQLLPTCDDQGKIKYEFVPGPFTYILKNAYESPNKSYVLIIEEINRGNAAAIFGDVFQLLDRNEEGVSVYGITNKDIQKELVKVGYKQSKVYLPRNLSIYATLNTSDQNVFVLDNAFKRRWKEVLIENNIDVCSYRENNIKQGVTWQNVFNTINNIVTDLVKRQECEEDKMLGAFYVKEEELADQNLFASKVLFYLWSDVAKYHRNEVFADNDEINTFEKLKRAFVGDRGFRVFNQTWLNSLGIKEADSFNEGNGIQSEAKELFVKEDGDSNEETEDVVDAALHIVKDENDSNAIALEQSDIQE